MHREIAVLNRTYMAGAETCIWRQSSHGQSVHDLPLGGVYVWCVCVCLQAWQATIKQAGRQGWQAAMFSCQKLWACVCPKQSRPLE